MPAIQRYSFLVVGGGPQPAAKSVATPEKAGAGQARKRGNLIIILATV